jgi:hypothetical protein
VLVKCSITELYPQPFFLLYFKDIFYIKMHLNLKTNLEILAGSWVALEVQFIIQTGTSLKVKGNANSNCPRTTGINQNCPRQIKIYGHANKMYTFY